MIALPKHGDLEAMARPALLDCWTQIFDRPAPRGISQPLLRRFLSFEIQARRIRGLDARSSARGSTARLRDESRASTRPMNPAGRLLREWNGVTHVVEVTVDGYHWNGGRYRSLSADRPRDHRRALVGPALLRI